MKADVVNTTVPLLPRQPDAEVGAHLENTPWARTNS